MSTFTKGAYKAHIVREIYAGATKVVRKVSKDGITKAVLQEVVDTYENLKLKKVGKGEYAILVS